MELCVGEDKMDEDKKHFRLSDSHKKEEIWKLNGFLKA